MRRLDSTLSEQFVESARSCPHSYATRFLRLVFSSHLLIGELLKNAYRCVARAFPSDAAVNETLRLVIQLTRLPSAGKGDPLRTQRKD